MTYQGGDETVATDQDTDKPDFTSTTLLRLILDYADNVEEAVEIASSYDLHDSANTSYHYMVADASGKSAILEWTNDAATDATDNDGSQRTLKVVYNDQDSDIGEREGACNFQAVTNFVLQPGYYEAWPPRRRRAPTGMTICTRCCRPLTAWWPTSRQPWTFCAVWAAAPGDNDDRNKLHRAQCGVQPDQEDGAVGLQRKLRRSHGGIQLLAGRLKSAPCFLAGRRGQWYTGNRPPPYGGNPYRKEQLYESGLSVAVHPLEDRQGGDQEPHRALPHGRHLPLRVDGTQPL